MSIDYIRCHFISDARIQCESWHSRADGDFCPVHKGAISTKSASNGINKDEYIDARKATEKSLREKIQGLNAQESCNLIDEHISRIEKVIEEQKLISLTARAIRSEIIEGMSEGDRQIRRLAKVGPPKEKKETKKRLTGSPAEMLSKFMANNPKMTEAVAKELLGMD